jgi:prophage antirepressor-like protein
LSNVVVRKYFNDVQIPFVQQEEDICIQAVVVAKALGYQKPREAVSNIITRNRTEFEGLTRSPNLGETADLAVTYATARYVFLTERGIYHFCMLAKTPKAEHFRKWVSSTLQIHRAQSITSFENSSLQAFELVAQQMNMLVDHMKEQNDRIAHLEIAARTFAIDRFQRGEIKRFVGQLAYMIAEIEDLDKPNQRHFQKLWTNFNNFFGLSSYQDLPKESYLEALELLDSWRERINQELAII